MASDGPAAVQIDERTWEVLGEKVSLPVEVYADGSYADGSVSGGGFAPPTSAPPPPDAPAQGAGGGSAGGASGSPGAEE